MSDYIPKSDADFKAWLENLETQATAAGATLGITAGDITTVGSSLESVRDTMAALADLTVRARQATQEKKAARRAAEEFARKLAKKIKGHTAYNEGFGQQLRITGPEDTTDLATAKPDLEGISHPNGTIELNFTKSKSDGVNIYSQRDGELSSCTWPVTPTRVNDRLQAARNSGRPFPLPKITQRRSHKKMTVGRDSRQALIFPCDFRQKEKGAMATTGAQMIQVIRMIRPGAHLWDKFTEGNQENEDSVPHLWSLHLICVGTINRRAWAVSRQRLGVRRPSGAFGRRPESGRGLPRSKTWRRFPSLSRISTPSVDQTFEHFTYYEPQPNSYPNPGTTDYRGLAYP